MTSQSGCFEMLKKIIASLFIFLISCSEDVKHPSPPIWAEKSRPEDLDERGIDAHNINLIYPDNNSINIS